MPSRQTIYNRRRDEIALRARIPPECRIEVYDAGAAFEVRALGATRVLVRGQQAVVSAWIEGYVQSWRDARRMGRPRRGTP